MARRRRVVNDVIAESVSPFLDLLLNGFGAIAVVFLLWVAIAPQTTPLELIGSERQPLLISGVPYWFAPATRGGEGDRVFRMSAQDEQWLGDWNLQFDKDTGSIFGNPRWTRGPSEPVARRQVDIEVTDDAKRPNKRTYDFVVAPRYVAGQDSPVRFVAADGFVGTAIVNQPFEATLGAEGSYPPYVWLPVDGSLPPGLELEPRTGRVHGHAASPGSYRFEVQVVASPARGNVGSGGPRIWDASSARHWFSIDVLREIEVWSALPDGRAKEAYNGRLGVTARSGEFTVQWKASVPGLQFFNDGRVSGTPTAPGKHIAAYAVIGRNGFRLEGTETITIYPALPDPELAGQILARVGENIHALIPFRGLMEPIEFEMADELPVGLTLKDGRIEGAPIAPGTKIVNLRATDSRGVRTRGSLSIVVRPPLQPLSLPGQRVVSLPVGQPVRWRPVASGGEGRQSWTFTGDLPATLRIEDNAIVGTPSVEGEWPIHCEVVDEETSQRAQADIVLKAVAVEPVPPRLLAGDPPVFVVGSPVAFSFGISGGVGDHTIEVTGLPQGLTATRTGFEGRFTVPIEQNIAVTLIDAIGRKAGPYDRTLKAVRADSSLPVVSTQSLPTALVAVDYSVTLAATGGIGKSQFSIEGNLPPGLSVDGSTVFGIPRQAGTWRLKISAADEIGQVSQAKELILMVRHGNPDPPRIATGSLPSAIQGLPYEIAIAISGGTGPLRTNVGGALPEGLEYKDGMISGVTRDVQSTNWTISVTDADGRRSETKTLQLTSRAFSSGVETPGRNVQSGVPVRMPAASPSPAVTAAPSNTTVFVEVGGGQQPRWSKIWRQPAGMYCYPLATSGSP